MKRQEPRQVLKTVKARARANAFTYSQHAFEAMVASWGDFEVHFDGLLGRGGMGSVYRAWQKSVGRWVAVKVLENSRSFDPELQQGFLQKFQIEIQTLARLNDPRIVTILQSGESDG